MISSAATTAPGLRVTMAWTASPHCSLGNSDDGALRDRRMLRHAVFDFGGIDIFAAGNDHVLDAIDDIDVTILVHVFAIAGVHPAVDDSFFSVSSGRSQ